jgi:hypothetical protein
MVEARLKHEIAIIDAYWDADGHAICPGASGLSHHLNPEGFIEFCPPLQFAFDRIEKNENFADKIGSSDKLELMRQSIVSETNGCIILNNPARLHAILKDLGATDTSGRNSAFAELQNMTKKPCHHIPGKEIPEKSFFYRLAKKFSFFGFSAYG